MFYKMSIAPMCAVPFSLTDFIYNHHCYTDTIMAMTREAIQLYIKINLMGLKMVLSLLENTWIPVLYTLTIGFILYGVFVALTFDFGDEPLTALEAEITQYIHANASTGSTVRMLYEHLERNYEDKDVDLEDVNKALQHLKKRGALLPVPTTLWVVSGN